MVEIKSYIANNLLIKMFIIALYEYNITYMCYRMKFNIIFYEYNIICQSYRMHSEFVK